MARTLPKERLLPSLLDRLTDDDPLNRSIELQHKSIQKIEKELALITQSTDKDLQENKNRQKSLQTQLDQAQTQYLDLASSVTSLSQIRDCVKRDLDWLLNARNYFPPNDLQDYPEIVTSVLNYGLPDLAGKTATGMDIRKLEKILKQAVIDFEPRILRHTVSVRLLVDESMLHHNSLTFEIEGEMWSDPLPIHLHLLTELELENGGVSITEFQA
ncbi:MAG: type VI secretion system baseplate subunit TssE [Methylococcales bacterium]